MKKIYCDECINFVDRVLIDQKNLLSGTKENAKCKLGKRVMFRVPLFHNNAYRPYYEGGYVRYCNEYKAK